MENGKAKDVFAEKDIALQHAGTKIVLPAKPREMTEDEGIHALARIRDEKNTFVSVYEEVEAYPLDGAFALMQVLRQKYGWATAVPKKSFWGNTPPSLVSIETGYGTSTQVVWGQLVVPGIDGELSTGMATSDKTNRKVFCIQGEVRKRFEKDVKEIANAVRAYVREHSVYRGKAIRLRTQGGKVVWTKPPTFMDTSRARPEELIFSEHIMAEVKASLFTPIEHTEAVRRYGVPLRRGVLLAGPFGTGKTLTANVVAKKCEDNGWTYVYLDDVAALAGALLFARDYSPAVVFAEDVDRAINDRTSSVDKVLNTIDGVDSKGSEVITILTTNYVDKIEPAMLRPGRLDAVISVLPPDAEAVQRLLRLYARGLLRDGEDLAEAGRALDGQIPAVIREVVERSKLHAIGRLEGGVEMELTGEDLKHAALGMRDHLALLNQDEEVISPEEALGRAFAKVAKPNGELEDLQQKTRDVQETVNDIHGAVC